MSKSKPHRTVTITAKLLRRLGACTDGLAAIRPRLPLKISTDPEANLKVAELIACDKRALAGWCDAGWFAQHFEHDPYPDSDHYLYKCDGLTVNPEARCVYMVAQQLAMAADGILMKRGR